MAERPDLDAIEKRLKAATPGPWYQSGPPWVNSGSIVLAGSPDPHVAAVIAEADVWGCERDEYAERGGAVELADPDDDAAFIAHAPADIRALVDYCRALEREVTLLKADIDEASHTPEPAPGPWS